MRRKTFGTILLIGIFASLSGVAYKVVDHLWQMKAREVRKDPTKVLDYLPEAALKISDFRRAKIEGGKKVWELFGDEARYLKSERQLLIKNPRMILYQKDSSTIEAAGKSGHLWLAGDEGEMEKAQLVGEVRLRYRDFLLHTEEILYVKGSSQVLLPGKVAMKGDGMELEGVGMEISLDDEKMRLLQKVRTKVEPQKLESRRTRPDGEKKRKL
jgi:LPS export ABC transporter protein LptC